MASGFRFAKYYTVSVSRGKNRTVKRLAYWELSRKEGNILHNGSFHVLFNYPYSGLHVLCNYPPHKQKNIL